MTLIYEFDPKILLGQGF